MAVGNAGIAGLLLAVGCTAGSGVDTGASNAATSTTPTWTTSGTSTSTGTGAGTVPGPPLLDQVDRSWTYAGPDGLDDVVRALAVPPDGGVCLAGHTTSLATYQDALVGCLDDDGAERWLVVAEGGAGGEDAGKGLAVDAAGRLVAAGIVMRAPSSGDTWAAAWEGDALAWEVTLDTAGDAVDFARAAAPDPDGGTVLAGLSAREGEAGDVWVGRLDADGLLTWSDAYGGAAHATDGARAVALGPDGEIAVAGYVGAETGDQDAWVGVWEADGSLRWTWSSGLAGDDAFWCVAFDGSGGLLAAGGQEGEGEDLLVQRLAADGTEAGGWTADAGGGGDDRFQACAWTGTHFAVAGYVGWSDGDTDLTWGLLDTDGQAVWSQVAEDPAGGDGAWALVVASPDRWFLGGSTGSVDGAGQAAVWSVFSLQGG